jgi:PIN domain nuclease of toxin-antitoxin system
MIVLDTHIWVWWINGSNELSNSKLQLIESSKEEGLAVSAISCWEVAKLVEKQRLKLTIAVDEWVERALAYPGVTLLPLESQIAVCSTQLPQPFHNDPADQIIVATARRLDCRLATDDERILKYPHVKLAWKRA